MKKKLTQKDFEEFKEECLRLQKEWGLSGWELAFDFQSLENDWAKSSIDLHGRIVRIILNPDLDDKWEEQNVHIKETAKHEMIHILLSPVASRAVWRYISKDELIAGEEEVVRTLEKLLGRSGIIENKKNGLMKSKKKPAKKPVKKAPKKKEAKKKKK